MKMSCGQGQGHVPSLCNNNIVEGVVLVAEASQSNPENHGGGCVGVIAIEMDSADARETKTPQKLGRSG